MTWIRTIPYPQGGARLKKAIDRLRELYPPEYDLPDQEAVRDEESVVAAHSLIPDALYHALATHGVLMSPQLPLSRAQQEMISMVVSVHNRCSY